MANTFVGMFVFGLEIDDPLVPLLFDCLPLGSGFLRLHIVPETNLGSSARFGCMLSAKSVTNTLSR